MFMHVGHYYMHMATWGMTVMTTCTWDDYMMNLAPISAVPAMSTGNLP